MLLSFNNIKLNKKCLLIKYFGNSHSESLYHEPQNSEYERLKEILKKKKINQYAFPLSSTRMLHCHFEGKGGIGQHMGPYQK